MMTPAELTRELGGYRAGTAYVAHCPAHNDSHPSLSISSGKKHPIILHCHTGCTQDEVVAALRERGLWGNNQERHEQPSRAWQMEQARIDQRKNRKMREAAVMIWKQATLPRHTIVETYLAERGLTGPLPRDIRFHANLMHTPTGRTYPGMVALVRDSTGKGTGIQRTFLRQDGRGKAEIDHPRMMLGDCRTGAVRLGDKASHIKDPGHTSIAVGEGIETCLSGEKIFGVPAWAALSAKNLKALALPPRVRSVLVLGDGDRDGIDAAKSVTQRFREEGRSVHPEYAPDGMDFNDVLKAQVKQQREYSLSR